MKPMLLIACVILTAASATAQIQVELRLPRLQYLAYESVVARVAITNLAGRDIDLRDSSGQPWLGFEITGADGQSLAPVAIGKDERNLSVAAGKTVTEKINLTPLYSVHDFGIYRVRAHVYLPEPGKFFYSQTKVFRVTDARPVWQRTVGLPDENPEAGATRTYSLLNNRFPDHTALYVRVEDKNRGLVYTTYSLGRMITFDEPQAEFDRLNQLHILHCASPRRWAYSHVGLNGELLAHSFFMESKTRPRLRHATDGTVQVLGGTIEASVAQSARRAGPNPPERPPEIPENE